MRRIGAPLTVTVVAALALTGCSHGGAQFSVRDSLAELPQRAAEGQQPLLVVVGDVSRTQKLAGVQAPDGQDPGGESGRRPCPGVSSSR